MPSPPIAVRDRELRIAAGSLLALIFVVNVYRAATQSITHDEAYTYLLFVSGTWSEVFSVYTANHHILHTFLVKLSIDTFGLSELTMRIPSLLGGLLYLVTSYRLVSLLFDRFGPRLLALALLTLNPYVAHFALFRYDAGTKRIFSQILGLDPPRPGAQLRLGVDWLFVPSINFHRRMYEARWIAPVNPRRAAWRRGLLRSPRRGLRVVHRRVATRGPVH